MIVSYPKRFDNCFDFVYDNRNYQGEKNSFMSVLDTKKIIMRVSVVTMIANFSLMALKLLAGIFGHSSALISDAVNSASDVICTVIVIIGVTISSKPIDDDHPYGHERLECVVSILLSVLLFGTGLAIGYMGVEKLIDGSYMQTEKPNALAIAAVAVTIAVKETLYWYTIKKAKSIDSVSLKASAWDHRVDVFSSLGVLVGIIGGMCGYPILDIIASLVICLLIARAAVNIFREASGKMVDKSCDRNFNDKIRRTLLSVKGVLRVDDIKTRVFGNRIYVDIEIGCYQNLPLITAHRIAQEAHDAVENLDERIKHCMVHVNPVDIDLLENEFSDREEQ